MLPPIMYAVQAGNAKMVKLLLENGADVNACDSRHYTLLHYACAGGHRYTAAHHTVVVLHCFPWDSLSAPGR